MDLSDLKSFAQSLKEKFTIADAASPEDQLKFPVSHLLEAAGNRYDLTVKTKLAMEPQLEDALDQVVAGPCFTVSDLPHPQPDECKPPAKGTTAGELLQEMGVDEPESGDNAE